MIAFVEKDRRNRRAIRLVSVLSTQRKGCTVAQIERLMKASRATIYRDLQLLCECGYALHREIVNGETRYSIAASALAIDPMTPKQHAAIALARRALAPLEGSWLISELDALLKRANSADPQETGVELALASPRYHPDVLRVLHEAVSRRCKLRLRYRGARDDGVKDRVVHPVHLQVVDQATVSHCLGRASPRHAHVQGRPHLAGEATAE
jgi:predicted DNA-binding transcriptional regulator YafY